MNRLVSTTVLTVGALAFLFAGPAARAEKEKVLFKTSAGEAYLAPDGAILAASSKENVRLITVSDQKARVLAEGHHLPTALAPDGKTVAVIRNVDPQTDEVTLFDVETAKPKDDPFKVPNALCHALTPDGNTLICGLVDLTLVDASNGKARHTFKNLGGQVNAVAVSADGKYLACGTFPDPADKPSKVWVWDLKTFEAVQSFTAFPHEINSVAFSPDGRRLAAACGAIVQLWDLESGKVAKSLKGKLETVGSVAFGNDGKALVLGRLDGLVVLWDLEADKALDKFKMPKGVGANLTSMSQDGKFLAVTTLTNEAFVFDMSAAYAK